MTRRQSLDSKLEECDSCGAYLTEADMEDAHTDDAGTVHRGCYEVDQACAAQRALAEYYYRIPTKEEIYEDARQSSIERYGFAI